MSYLSRKPRSALGDFASVVIQTLNNAGGALGTGSKVVTDPYLPEVLCRVNQLAQIEQRVPITACAKTPPGRTGGIGLRKVVAPLRAYVYAEQRPWIQPVAIAAAVGVPFVLGYLLGRK
jgi:hypothetical protein